MKVDDSKFEILNFNGQLDNYWYEMGYNSYTQYTPSIEPGLKVTKNQLLSYKKGIMDAARNRKKLEPDDFYSYKEEIFYRN